MAAYQTRICDYVGMERPAGDAALSAYAELYGRVERKLFAEVAAGKATTSLKIEYLKRFRIPARMFNGVRVSLEGKIASVQEQQKLQLDSLGRRIARAQGQIAGAVDHGRWGQVHKKGRRLATLQSRLVALEADMAWERVRLCFGSKRLWRKQHQLEENGYASHQEWLRDWQDARSDEFFVLGSRDETAGCQLCVATVADDGTLTLRLRMPDCLAGRHGKYLTIAGVHFNHGYEQVLAALGEQRGIRCLPVRARGRAAAAANWARHQLPVQAGRERMAGLRHHCNDGRAGGVPVASPKNVTENSALWVARRQRHFRQSGWVW